MKSTIVIAGVALLALAGCQSSSGSGGAAASAGGQIVAAAQMPDFCRAQAAQQLRANLEDLSSNDPVVTASGTVIAGEWDSPNNDAVVVPFQCRFGPDGSFQGVTRA